MFNGAIADTSDGLSFTYDGRAERILGAVVSPNYFTFLGVNTAIGQPFSRSVRDGHWAAEAVLSYRFWRNRFGGDPSVIGRVIHLNTYPFTIVGVSAPSFYDLTRGVDPELRIPLMPEGQSLPQIALLSPSDFCCLSWARLAPGVTLAQAGGAVDPEFLDMLRSGPLFEESRRLRPGHVRALAGGRGWSGFLDSFATPLFVLFALVGGVLLIACANVANMLLARSAARKRELAVRCSVGAGRGRLIRQMLAESVLLSLIGGGIGIVAAWWAGPLLLHFVPTSNLIPVLDLHPDLRALWFTFALAALTGILFGLAPALQATRGDLAAVLKADSAASIGDRQSALFRKALITGQVAFSLALLVAAGWFVQTLIHARPHELAADPDRVLQFMIKPQHEIYNESRMRATIDELLRHVSQIPGVDSVALAHPGPYNGHQNGRLVTTPGGGSARVVDDHVTAGFFRTIGLKLVAGRDFNESDKPGAEPVAVINRAAARALYGDANPLGRTFTRTDGDGAANYRVIGVVADMHYYELYGAPQPAVFLTFQRVAPYMPMLHVRTSRPDTAGMIAAIRRAFDEVDTGFPVFNIKTMAMRIDDALARERMLADLAAAFGILALLLAAVGMYGVLAYFVTLRSREIGIRMALGSDASAIIWLVAREALQLVIVGCAAGIPLALLLRRSIAVYLFGVSAADPATLLAAAALLLVTAAAAVCIPAIRASRVDPLVALRTF
jgi:predicted permease